MEEVLLSKTRIRILKLLKERRRILSDLAKELGLSKSTVHEHLKKLEEAGLVKRVDDGHKWIYFELTEKGSSLFHPVTKRITLLFSLALISLCVGIYQISILLSPKPLPLAKGVAGVERFAPSFAGDFATMFLAILSIAVSIFLFLLFFRTVRKNRTFSLSF